MFVPMRQNASEPQSPKHPVTQKAIKADTSRSVGTAHSFGAEGSPGWASEAAPRRHMAVPFVGKDAPSAAWRKGMRWVGQKMMAMEGTKHGPNVKERFFEKFGV